MIHELRMYTLEPGTAGAVVEVLVRDEDGRPVPKAYVQFLDEAGNVMETWIEGRPVYQRSSAAA